MSRGASIRGYLGAFRAFSHGRQSRPGPDRLAQQGGRWERTRAAKLVGPAICGPLRQVLENEGVLANLGGDLGNYDLLPITTDIDQFSGRRRYRRGISLRLIR